jgi:hypothetical protein
MKWDKAKQIDESRNSFEIPKNWLQIHYYEALNILFRIENALRIFVYSILKNKLFEKWSEIEIISDDGNKTSIQLLAKKRISQTEDFGYLGYDMDCPIMYLTSGELIHIITHESYWPYFNIYFKAKKDIIKNKLDEIGNVRNALAHFRAIKPEDVEVVKSNSLHLFLLIREYISNLISYGDLIPSNLDKDWYLKIKTLNFPSGKIIFRESENKEWVKIELVFNMPVIEKTSLLSDFKSYKVLNLITPQILNNGGEIKKYVTYLSEGSPIVDKSNVNAFSFSKSLYLTIKEDCITKNYLDIYSGLNKLIENVTSEIDLINKDHFAAGKIIKTSNVFFWFDKDEKQWKGNLDSLACRTKESDPVEYWGSFYSIFGEFIITTHRYPWIPVDVSKLISPF